MFMHQVIVFYSPKWKAKKLKTCEILKNYWHKNFFPFFNRIFLEYDAVTHHLNFVLVIRHHYRKKLYPKYNSTRLLVNFNGQKEGCKTCFNKKKLELLSDDKINHEANSCQSKNAKFQRLTFTHYIF